MDTETKVLGAVMEDAPGTMGAKGAPGPAWGIQKSSKRR